MSAAPPAGRSDGERAVVVGGGVIGVACAHFLQERGYAVTVIDRGRIGGACSHSNCGLITPSHVLPLAEPGTIRKAFASLFQWNPPLRVKARLSPALWSWLWRFARRCNERDMLESAHGIHALLTSSMSLYESLVAEGKLDCEWQKRGLMFVYRTKEAFEKYRPVNDLLAEKFDEPATPIAGDELVAMEPALVPGLAGAWFFEGDAHTRPDKVVSSWRTHLVGRGVRFVEECAVREFTRTNGTCTGIRTDGEEFAADVFVVATGALTPQLNEWLGIDVPIQPGKGYSITMAHPPIVPRYPLLLPEHRVAVTPMESAYRLGSIMEFAGYDESIKPSRLKLLTAGAAHYLREPVGEPVEETWFGWRPMTPDSRPLIGRVPAMSNVWLAAGHNMLGLSMAPATGRLVAEMIAGATPHVAVEPYEVTRFR